MAKGILTRYEKKILPSEGGGVLGPEPRHDGGEGFSNAAGQGRSCATSSSLGTVNPWGWTRDLQRSRPAELLDVIKVCTQPNTEKSLNAHQHECILHVFWPQHLFFPL